MKKIIIFISILSFLIVGIIYSINYNNVKNVERCQNTQDENSLISCFEYPLKTPNEKMIMIMNHKNFKFSELKNLNSYMHFVGLLMGEYGECNMTLNCKKEFSNKITNFKEYLEPIVEQCKIIIDNECKEIKKPLQ